MQGNDKFARSVPNAIREDKCVTAALGVVARHISESEAGESYCGRRPGYDESIVKTLKALPSYGTLDYLFPSHPTARCPEPQRPYRWDFGKQFRALAKAASVQNVRIHDLRHAGATILMTLGVPDPIVRKITGHRSRELERYQHLTPELRALTVNLIATELFRAKRARKERENGTPTGTLRGRRVTENSDASQRLARRRVNGGVDGARTRDLRRDRPAF